MDAVIEFSPPVRVRRFRRRECGKTLMRAARLHGIRFYRENERLFTDPPICYEFRYEGDRYTGVFRGTCVCVSERGYVSDSGTFLAALWAPKEDGVAELKALGLSANSLKSRAKYEWIEADVPIFVLRPGLSSSGFYIVREYLGVRGAGRSLGKVLPYESDGVDELWKVVKKAGLLRRSSNRTTMSRSGC